MYPRAHSLEIVRKPHTRESIGELSKPRIIAIKVLKDDTNVAVRSNGRERAAYRPRKLNFTGQASRRVETALFDDLPHRLDARRVQRRLVRLELLGLVRKIGMPVV